MRKTSKECNAKYRAKNREVLKEKSRAYRVKNKEKCAALVKAWRDRNPGYKQRRKPDTAKDRARKARYEHRKLTLIHPNSNHELIFGFYQKAEKATTSTGVHHVVDHIIPIAHGGFHHHENLQVIPKSTNSSKQDDPFWHDPRYLSWKDVPKSLWPEGLRPIYEKLLAT